MADRPDPLVLVERNLSGGVPPYPDDTRARGWRFEVDTETIKSSDTWLRAKSGEVRGALLLLWAEAWQQTPCGTLPNDDELIALIIDMSPKTFAKHRAVLMRGWSLCENGRLYHETITDRVLAMLDKRTKDAQRAANARERSRDKRRSGVVVTDASRVTPSEVTSEFDTEHQAPSTSIKKTTNPNGLVADGDADPPNPPTEKVPDCPHKEILALYHELLPTSPSIRDWTPARSEALRTRWREDVSRQSLDWWRRFFDYVGRSEFLTGRASAAGRKPFCPGLEWICKAENFAKIREGRYHEDLAA